MLRCAGRALSLTEAWTDEEEHAREAVADRSSGDGASGLDMDEGELDRGGVATTVANDELRDVPIAVSCESFFDTPKSSRRAGLSGPRR